MLTVFLEQLSFQEGLHVAVLACVNKESALTLAEDLLEVPAYQWK